MIGGLMKSTSHYALAAAAGLFAGGLAISPAQAADLGGDCCADLEERVAELEATTVRKGNRVVSVQLYGQVNKALMVWDDGIDSDAYVVDSDISSTRFGLRGSGTIKPGWTAGFRLEMQLESASSISVSQDYEDLPGDDAAGEGNFSTRRASLYIESAQLGRVTMGLTSLATDDLVYTYLGSVNVTGAEFFGGGLRLRTSDGGFLGGAGTGTLGSPGLPDANAIALGSVATDTDIGRDDAIRYDSPSLFGFIFSAAWGESDVADVALRFKKEWNSIQIVAAAGYRWDGDNDKTRFDGRDVVTNGGINFADTETFILAGGLKHTPSGLFLNGVWVQQEQDGLRQQLSSTQVTIGSADFDGTLDASSVEGEGIVAGNFNPPTGSITQNLTASITDQAAAAAEDEATYYSIFGGIERNWTGHGLTSIFGRYTVYEDFGAGQLGDFDGDGFADDVLTGSEVNVWGFGIEQDFDSAALEIYAHFNYFEIDDVSYQTINGDGDTGEAFDLVTEAGKAKVEDIWVGYLGTRIKF